MKARNCLLASVVLCVSGLLIGCGGTMAAGGGSTSTGSTKGTSADLRGGWLIAGTMPLSSLLGSGSYPFGLALNLDILNGQVTGYGSMELPCGGSSGAFTGAVGGGVRLASATVAADGSFTLTDVLVGSNTQHQVVVQGTVPAVAGGVWSGTYTVSAPLSNCNGVVPPAQTGAFTAQKIADLDGTFAGKGTVNGAGNGAGNGTGNGNSTAVTFSASLTQGGAASLNGLTDRLNDQNVLNGTLQVQGISCFKSGTVRTSAGFPAASLTGNQALMEFLMDDGSTVLMNGTEADTAASTLVAVSLLVSGGACDKTFVSLTTVVKQ